MLLFGQTTLPAVGFIALFGAAQGAATLARPAILAEVYGAANYGRILSVLSMLLTLTATAAQGAAGLIYDAQQSYDLVLGLVAGLSIAATATLWLARRVSGPVRDEMTEFTSDAALDWRGPVRVPGPRWLCSGWRPANGSRPAPAITFARQPTAPYRALLPQ